MLRTVVSEQQNDWDNHLPAALCTYRSTPQASTGVSPHKMVYGVVMTFSLDLMLGDTGPEQPKHECPYEYVEWIKDSLRHAHSKVQNAQDFCQTSALLIWTAKSDCSISPWRMGLESLPPTGRQIALS